VSMRRFALFALVFIIVGSGALAAWDIDQTVGSNFAYYPDNHKGYPEGGGFLWPSYSPLDPADDGDWTGGGLYGGADSDDPRVRKLGSGWGAVEIEGYYRFRATMPFLAGDGPLTSGNNLRFVVKPVLTPVSLHVENEVHFTPIAFLVLSGGISLGTGWPLDFLNLHGLALNTQANIEDTEVSGFAGHYYLGGTFQFDLAAVVPGEMNHVVVQATAKARYMHYSKAEDMEAWYWRTEGDNFNGWEYRGDYALGWMAPWKVNFLGIVAEHRFWLSKDIRESSTIDSGGWGSDFHKWRFGPAANIDLGDGHGLTVVLHFKNGLYYTPETVYSRWFMDWDATGDKYVKIDRLALAYSWNM